MQARKRQSPQKRPGSRTYSAPKLIDTLTILGQHVTVYHVSFPDQDRWGEWRPGNREIHLERGFTSDRHAADVMLHEVTHAVSDMNLSEKDRLTESQATTLAIGLTDLFANNPKFVRTFLNLLKRNKRR